MSSGRFSGLATASKAISGAVWADAGSAPRQVAASTANKKRFIVTLLMMFLCVQRHCRLDPAIHLRAKKMDPRVKPAGDGQRVDHLRRNGSRSDATAPLPSSWRPASG